jgi:hypothetical protein
MIAAIVNKYSLRSRNMVLQQLCKKTEDDCGYDLLNSIAEPIILKCGDILDIRNTRSHADEATHPNLAYLKLLAFDILAVHWDKPGQGSFSQKSVYAKAHEYSTNNKISDYSNISLYAIYKAHLEDHYKDTKFICKLNVSRSVASLASMIPYLHRLRSLIKTDDIKRLGMMLTYMLYVYHPNMIKHWIIQPFNTKHISIIKDILEHILNVNESQLPSHTRKINIVIADRIHIYYLNASQFDLDDENVISEIKRSIYFILHILHITNIKIICRSYITSKYGGNYMDLHNSISEYVSALLDWKLKQ